LEDDDPLEWKAALDGSLTLSLLAVGFIFFVDVTVSVTNTIKQEGIETSAPINFSTRATSAAVSSIAPSDSVSVDAPAIYKFEADSIQMTIATTLNVPVYLTDRKKRSLRLAYAKYEAYIDAHNKIHQMTSNGSWTAKNPAKDEIVEVFFSKSNFHKYHSKVFPCVAVYPDLLKWLRGDPDAPADIEVWNSDKPSIENLAVILDRRDQQMKQGRDEQGRDEQGVESSSESDGRYDHKGKGKAKSKAKVKSKQKGSKRGESDEDDGTQESSGKKRRQW
jgi:hypothetical protein